MGFDATKLPPAQQRAMEQVLAKELKAGNITLEAKPYINLSRGHSSGQRIDLTTKSGFSYSGEVASEPSHLTTIEQKARFLMGTLQSMSEFGYKGATRLLENLATAAKSGNLNSFFNVGGVALSQLADAKDAKDPKKVAAFVDRLQNGDAAAAIQFGTMVPGHPMKIAVQEEINRRALGAGTI